MKATMRRATVYFDPAVHRALRLRAAATDQSISELINDAVGASLLEDTEDLAAFDERAGETDVRFVDAVKSMRHRGKL